MPFPSIIQFFSRTTPSRKTVKSTHAAERALDAQCAPDGPAEEPVHHLDVNPVDEQGRPAEFL